MALRCVIHCHTEYSKDSSWRLPAIVAACQRHHIDVIAITDHDTISGAQALQQIAPANLQVIIGQEISTLQGDLVGLYLTTKIEPHQSIQTTIAEIHRQGGLVVLPHPFDRVRRKAVGKQVATAIKNEIDLIETFNARCVLSADNVTAAQFADEHGLATTAAADAHFASELTNAICLLEQCNTAQTFLTSMQQTRLIVQKAALSVHLRSAWAKLHINILILVGFIGLCISINLPAYWHVSASTTMLNTLSGDEGVYYDWLTGFYALLQNHDIYGLMVFKDPWGYGTLFWYVYGLFTWPIYQFGSFTAVIIILRCISAIWLGVSLFFIYKIIYQLRQQRSVALLGALMLLTAPGYYFYFKAFSAEFMLLAFSLASIYYLVKDAWVGGRNYLIALGLLGIAIGLKVALLLFVPIYVCYALWIYRKLMIRTWIRRIVLAGICLGIGFALCNPYLVITNRTGVNYYFNLVRINMLDNATGHGTDISGIDYQAWYREVITHDFFPTALIVIFVIAYLLTIIQEGRRRQYTAALLLILTLGYSLYIMLQVKKLWAWYLFPGMSLLPIGLYIMNFQDYTWLKKYIKFQPYILALLVIFNLVWNRHVIQTQYVSFIDRDQNYEQR